MQRRKTLHLASLNNLLEETKRDLHDFSTKTLGHSSMRCGGVELVDCLPSSRNQCSQEEEEEERSLIKGS